MKFRENVNTDLVAGILGLLVMAVFWCSREGVGYLSIMFPNSLLILVGVFSAILVVKAFVRPERKDVFTDGNQKRIVVTGVILFAWVFGIMFLGFLSASIVAFPVLVCYLASAREKVTPKKGLLWTAISTVEVIAFYLIFSRILEVPLPTGILI